MNAPHKHRAVPVQTTRREPLSILELLLLVAGAGIGLAVTRPIWTAPYQTDNSDPIAMVPIVVRVVVAVLSGFSFIGVPLLLARLTRRRTPWGPGKIAWFCQGAATWLLWPPILYYQLPMQQVRDGPLYSSVCWLWGTPLMGLYMTLAILAGGWFGRRGRRRLKRSFREQFGLFLSCLWACTGLYFLGLLYWIDLFKRD
ncbi:MAG TPA: hypothetical protein PLF81_13775 [Candidatus Anammoximicrobium sp.]|nr:hypothetical protein [Candidatus Anammoximicrobium sp.]